MKTFHTFHGGRKKKCQTHCCSHRSNSSARAKYSNKALFFSWQIFTFRAAKMGNRLCLRGKSTEIFARKYVVCITMCRFKMRLTNVLVGKKKKKKLQNLITTLYTAGYDTQQWCEWEIKATKFTMQMADLYIPAHRQSINSLTNTKYDENAQFRPLCLEFDCPLLFIAGDCIRLAKFSLKHTKCKAEIPCIPCIKCVSPY